jgi:hypothetical protein
MMMSGSRLRNNGARHRNGEFPPRWDVEGHVADGGDADGLVYECLLKPSSSSLAAKANRTRGALTRRIRGDAVNTRLIYVTIARLDQLVYILAYRDAAARDSAWAAFNADPEWVKTRTEMQVSVDVDNTFMVATDYSPLK